MSFIDPVVPPGTIEPETKAPYLSTETFWQSYFMTVLLVAIGANFFSFVDQTYRELMGIAEISGLEYFLIFIFLSFLFVIILKYIVAKPLKAVF